MKTYITTTTLTVETKPLGIEGYLAYRCMNSSKREGQEVGTTEVWEGICHESRPPQPGNARPESQFDEDWFLIEQKYIDALARYGWSHLPDEVSQVWPINHVSTAPFSDLENDSLQLIRVCFASHMVFDRHNKALPVAHYCDYILWHLDNAHYDLDKVIEILNKRSDIHNLQRGRIPYYNCEEGRDESVSFVWASDIDTYRKAWAWCLDQKFDYPSTHMPHAVRALDLLGIEVAKKKEWYE